MKGGSSGKMRRRGRGKREDWVFATGSFDATAGIWRRKERWDLIGSDASDGDERGSAEKMSIDGDDFNGGSGEENCGSGADEDDEDDEDDDEWRYAVALEGHDSEIKSVAWSPTGQFLATCARDKSVWVWEEVIDSFSGGGGIGTHLSVNADSSDNFETVAVLSEHEGDVKCVAWHPSPDVNLLASGSYDDTIRLYRDDIDDDWSCVAVLNGHEDTVWFVDFEGLGLTKPAWPSCEDIGDGAKNEEVIKSQVRQERKRAAAGPRLVSSSADGTIRIWTKVPPPSSLEEEQDTNSASQPSQPRVPSIIRSAAATAALDEEWIEECELPRRHDEGAAVYAVAWSKKSGRIVSTGNDGRIVVYEEAWRLKRETASTSLIENGNTINKNNGTTLYESSDVGEDQGTAWVVIAEIEAAHGVYEVNHVCWAPWWGIGRGHGDLNNVHGFVDEKNKSNNSDEEEVIITTGDDGEVKIWTLR